MYIISQLHKLVKVKNCTKKIRDFFQKSIQFNLYFFVGTTAQIFINFSLFTVANKAADLLQASEYKVKPSERIFRTVLLL